MDEYRTRETLLERLSNQYDEKAWEEFIHFYERFIYSILRKNKLSPEESQDVCQQVLLKLWKVLPDFDYNRNKGGFRSWLYRVTRNALCDYWKKNKRHRDKINNLAEEGPTASDDSPLELMMDREWETHITRLALENMNNHFSEKALNIFRELLDGQQVSNIALEYDVAENTVYVYKKRIKARMLSEIRFLKDQLG